jgi:hypothetical protein
VPARATTVARPSEPEPTVRFRRPAAELVGRAARRVVRGGRATFRSQAAFREAVLEVMRREEPLATIGGPRLRRLLLDVPGVRVSVRYREAAEGAPPAACPVCGSPLTEIRNRTLDGDRIVLGRKCTRCDYWTHGRRRVPVRYSFSKAGIDGRPLSARA